VKGHPRAQRRLLEDHRQSLPAQRVAVGGGSRLHTQPEIKKALDLLRGEIPDRQEVAGAHLVTSAKTGFRLAVNSVRISSRPGLDTSSASYETRTLGLFRLRILVRFTGVATDTQQAVSRMVAFGLFLRMFSLTTWTSCGAAVSTLLMISTCPRRRLTSPG